MKKGLNICICGGGSLGTVCSGLFAAEGHNVMLYTGHPERWEKDITVTDIFGKIFSGRLAKISAKPEDVVPDADIVLLCVPGYMIESTLTSIKPFLRHDSAVGTIVSSTGFFYFAHEILVADTPFFGFQRVPFIARVKEYGKSASLLGYKKLLNVAIENVADKESFRRLLEKLFRTPVAVLRNFHEAALTNSNPILHTGRLYSMWKGREKQGTPTPILFYEEWDDCSSETVLRMDDEFMQLTAALGIGKDSVPSLLTYYESNDAQSFTKKLRSIAAFRGITAPMIEIDSLWYPDFTSRYFTEDFPFGLRFIVELARQKGLPIPTIEQVFQWGMSQI